jgi:cellobiose phosphorylase
MYQLIVDSLLGLGRRRNQLFLRPLLPRAWSAFEMRYRYGVSTYDITCREAESAAAAGVTVDGVKASDATIAMVDDGQRHSVAVNVWRGT